MFKEFEAIVGAPKLDFVSLMIALSAALLHCPHLDSLLHVRDAAAARNSTIVGIASIGLSMC